MSLAAQPSSVIAFPKADLRAVLGNALKRHRLPETLAAALVREAQRFPDVGADAALAFALDQRIAPQPIDFEKTRGIVLLGASGAGKSAVAAKIMRAARLTGRTTDLTRADAGLAMFRSKVHPCEHLAVMEAEGFNPLNLRAASAFAALGDMEDVEVVGVVSALNDAEDVSDIMAAFRFRRVIVTNMDRTRRLGALLAAVTGGARLAHVTRGGHADDALETLAPGTLAAMLLDTQQH